MAEHSTLTGTSLHEPKGASTASANEVYVFDGAGSGTTQKLTEDSVTRAKAVAAAGGTDYTILQLSSTDTSDGETTVGEFVNPFEGTLRFQIQGGTTSASFGMTFRLYKNGSLQETQLLSDYGANGTVQIADFGNKTVVKGDIWKATVSAAAAKSSTQNFFVKTDTLVPTIVVLEGTEV